MDLRFCSGENSDYDLLGCGTIGLLNCMASLIKRIGNLIDFIVP
jgi:hypothetical protein